MATVQNGTDPKVESISVEQKHMVASNKVHRETTRCSNAVLFKIVKSDIQRTVFMSSSFSSSTLGSFSFRSNQ